MFDPERVVVSGAIAAGMTDVVAAARRALPTDLDLPAPTIALSDLGADVVVRGAVAAAASHARERALDVWTFARP
jgi:predicted NBD/HSP70 family sugar kinase